jgi:hypothetical protein
MALGNTLANSAGHSAGPWFVHPLQTIPLIPQTHPDTPPDGNTPWMLAGYWWARSQGCLRPAQRPRQHPTSSPPGIRPAFPSGTVTGQCGTRPGRRRNRAGRAVAGQLPGCTRPQLQNHAQPLQGSPEARSTLLAVADTHSAMPRCWRRFQAPLVMDDIRVTPILRDAALEGGLQGQERPRDPIPEAGRKHRPRLSAAMRTFLGAVERRRRREQGQVNADAMADLRAITAWEDRHGGDGLPELRPWEPGARRGR